MEDYGLILKMGSKITTIEVYPNYDENGSLNLNLIFSYGCPDLDLMGYSEINDLIEDIRNKLKEKSE